MILLISEELSHSLNSSPDSDCSNSMDEVLLNEDSAKENLPFYVKQPPPALIRVPCRPPSKYLHQLNVNQSI